jgi:cytochrome c oxidase cbb3-type subunit 2
MPSYPWLFESILDGEDIQDKMRSLRILGVPYSDEQISSARLEVRGRTKGEVLISYLQQLGVTSASGN